VSLKSAGIKCTLLVGVAMAFATPMTYAQNDSKVLWEEYEKNIKTRESIAALGPTLFGDAVNLSNGALSFSTTDVSLRGNNALPVEITRTYSAKRWKGLAHDDAFADWSIALPNISGIYSASQGWISGSATTPLNRCSITTMGVARPPNINMGGGIFFRSDDYWKGLSLEIPGSGGGELLLADAGARAPATGGPYYWVTNDFTYAGCLPSIGNGDGEGFFAITPNGVRYEFTHMASFVEPRLKDTASFYLTGAHTKYLPRRRFALYATRAEDRFGNWVEYTYQNAAGSPVRLKQITSSDGRTITLEYNPQGNISSVTAAGRPWTYQYAYPSSASGTLTGVTQPDNRVWGIDFAALSSADIDFQTGDPGEILRNCQSTGTYMNPGVGFVGTITHPSGATAEFTITPKKHRRTNVPEICEGVTSPGNDPNDDTAYYPVVYDLLSLTKKKVTGVGLSPMEWAYSYTTAGGSAFIPPTDPCATTGCPGGVSITSVTGPDDFIRYTFGNSFRYDEGKLLKVENGASSTSILDVIDTSYFLGMSRKVGSSPSWRGDAYVSEYLLPQSRQVIQRDGVSYTTAVNALDPTFARPTSVTSASSAGNSRTNVTAYHDNLSLWVLGQTATVTCTVAVPASAACDGDVVSKTDYDVNAMPWKTWAFGKLQQTLTYHPDGTLKTVSDGRDGTNFDTTVTFPLTLSNGQPNWKRGIPQQIQHPATPDHPVVYQNAGVNNHGEIDWVTDENGYKTCYTYDAMGRLASITYPSEAPNVYGVCNTSTWAAKTLSFVPYTAGPKYGIAAGHWQQTVSTGTGNARKVTYYDALWRPLVEEAYDNADAAGTRSLTVKRYDSSGRLAFQSYPMRTLSNYATVTAGTSSYYDALDRPTLVRQTSELGNLDTTTDYLPGFKTRVTLPKHQGPNPTIYTDTTYQAWDQPTTEFPKTIAQPEGALTTIDRDAFGKPTAITRSGGGLSLTRRYVYNAAQELCKSIEPETGSTVMHYDAAGNLDWSAAGLALPSTTSCDDTHGSIAARKVTRSYDQRNRLKTLRFLADTRGDQDWFYTPDGLPSKVVTVNVPGAVHPENHYVYNKRRMLTTETQHLPAWYSYSLGYNYDANGSLKRINYPSSDYVDFAPNALGQARQVTGPHASTPGATMNYASQVTYHPNGSVAGFTYGNDIAYQMRYPTHPNARPLPEVVDSVGVQRYVYWYDGNGNPTHIHDQTRGGDYSRLLQYDGLDRLTGAGSVSFGGDDWHRFTYDAMDNLVTWKHGGVKDHRYCYNTANQLEFVRTGATACSGAGAGNAADYFHYDVQGNVDVHDDHGFDFDTGNRLREVIDVERYRYDAHGRRVLAMNFASGTITSQYGQNGQLLYQKNQRTGQEKQIDHIYLAGSLIAQREQPLTGGTAVVKYLHTDALGSPVAVTNASNPLTGIERMEYEPYGKQMATTTSIGQDRPGYTGHVRDTATGMLYAQQRYLHGDHPVFLSVDPVTALSSPVGQFHRYRYANNNPYRFTDPDGRQACPKGERCIEGRSTRNAPQQPAPSEQRRAVDSQVVSAARSGSFSDGTKIDMSQQEQSFSANKSGTKAGIDQEQRCMQCGGENVLKMTFKIPSGDSAGHTHGGNREQKPGLEDAPARVGDTRYVVTKANVMAVDRTEAGPRVRIIDGSMPRGQERRDIENRIEGWNQNQNVPSSCVPSTGC
jgi:RHS repeat-associated protein